MNKLTKSAAGLMLALSAFAFSGCDDNSDVIGLNDATKYGFIKVTIEGEDPNGNDFEATKNFKFFPSGSPENSSSVYTYSDDGFFRYFNVDRFISPFDGGDNSEAYLYLAMQDEEDPSVYNAYLNLETTVITENNEFFSLSEEFNIDDQDITSYSYNPETGRLSVKFVKELNDDETNLGQDLTITVHVSVKVFENINPVNR